MSVSSCAAFSCTYCRAASCASATSVSWLTADAPRFCRDVLNCSTFPRQLPPKFHRAAPISPCSGVLFAKAPWLLWNASLLPRPVCAPLLRKSAHAEHSIFLISNLSRPWQFIPEVCSHAGLPTCPPSAASTVPHSYPHVWCFLVRPDLSATNHSEKAPDSKPITAGRLTSNGCIESVPASGIRVFLRHRTPGRFRYSSIVSLPQRGFGLFILFFVRSCLTCGRSAVRRKRAAGGHRNPIASHAQRKACRRPPRRADEAAERKPTFAGCHRSGQRLAG
jgi:hypothetical protein